MQLYQVNIPIIMQLCISLESISDFTIKKNVH